MSAKPVILQLGAQYGVVDSIRQLERCGMSVFAADPYPVSNEVRALLSGFKAIDITDGRAIRAFARSVKADVVLAVNDYGALSASVASRRIGRRYIPLRVAIRARDKGLMRDAWKLAGLPQPRYRVARSRDEIERAAVELDFPLVLKPAMNCGSRGVSIVRDANELEWSIAFAQSTLRNARYIIERFIPGTEVTVEGLAQDGEIFILAKSDKEHQKHPRYQVAMALNYPARFSPSVLEKIDSVVTRAALALGIRDGAIHCECLVNDEGVFLVEMAARPGGQKIFGQVVESVSGIPMPEALARIFLGEKQDLRPKHQKGSCYKFFRPPNGIFQAVHGLEEAKRYPGVLDIGFQLSPGTMVGDIASDNERPGYIVSAGATREEAIANADRAIASLRYEINSLVQTLHKAA